jgi:hypothetical protein
MKSFVRTCLALVAFGIVSMNFDLYAQNTPNIPREYYPNYLISSDWDRIHEYLVQVDASQRTSVPVGSDVFRELAARFKKVFAAWPQDYRFQVTYTQCIQLTEQLGNQYSETTFYSFMSNCFRPLQQHITTFNNQYTVKAHATRNPPAGSAPLTVTFDAR